MPDTGHYASILHITDPHILPAPESRLLGIDTAYYLDAVLSEAMNGGHCFDLCLITGDLTQEPNAASYERLLVILQNYGIPFTCLPGNHDDYELMLTLLAAGKINCRKEIVLKNWRIICLNSQIPGSAAGNLPSGELAFMVDCLDRNPDLNTLIAVHHHCVPTGSLWMDSMIIDNAAEFFSAVKPYPQVKAVINGHIHQEMDFKVNGIRVMTTPSTCFQFKPQSLEFCLDDTNPGYRWLNLYEDGGISTGVIRLSEPLRGLETSTKGY